MEYQYKVIISNRTVYKEFEIQPDMDRDWEQVHPVNFD